MIIVAAFMCSRASALTSTCAMSGSLVPTTVLMTIDLPSVFLSTPFIVQPLPSQKSTWGQGVATASFHATTAWAMAVGMTIPGSVDGVAPGLGVGIAPSRYFTV